jgi:hypothetical protein
MARIDGSLPEAMDPLPLTSDRVLESKRAVGFRQPTACSRKRSVA